MNERKWRKDRRTDAMATPPPQANDKEPPSRTNDLVLARERPLERVVQGVFGLVGSSPGSDEGAKNARKALFIDALPFGSIQPGLYRAFTSEEGWGTGSA